MYREWLLLRADEDLKRLGGRDAMANVSLAMSFSVKTLKAYTLYGTETILKFDSYPPKS